MNKINKVKAIIFSTLFAVIIIIVFLKYLPKLFSFFSSLSGFYLDRKDLYVKYIIGTIVRLLGVITILYLIFKFNITKVIKFKWNKKYFLYSIVFFVYIGFNISFVSISAENILLVILMIFWCLCVCIF